MVDLKLATLPAKRVVKNSFVSREYIVFGDLCSVGSQVGIC